jgi:hypothetical protein
MRYIFLLFVGLLISNLALADGNKTLKIRGMKYNPNPKQANIGNAVNVYAGFTSYDGAKAGYSLMANYELPFLDPNLTIGPEVGFGFSPNAIDFNFFGFRGNFSQTTLKFNVKATYYADWLIPNMPEDFDAFVSTSLGIYYATYEQSIVPNKVGIHWNTGVGGRWHFDDYMSIYAILGVGNTYIAGGISFKI